MFCSKCGKTIRPEDQRCPGCDAPIGDNRFGGIPYTSAQFTIKPGQTVFEPEPLNNYTRTTYTGMADADQSNSESDSRTTYRPVYEGASAPEDVRRDMRAAVAEVNAENEPEEEIEEEIEEILPEPEYLSPMAQETLDQLDEDLRPDEEIDRSQFRVRPIQSTGRAGISRDVSEYIAKLEGDQSRRGRHRRAAEPVYDEYPAEEPAYADDQQDLSADDYYPEQDGVFDEIDDEEFEDMRRERRFNPMQIIKIVVALVVVAALFVGGVVWIRYISGNRSNAPIEGVSETLYEEGIALIKSRTESSYINEHINTYKSSGAASMVLQLSNDSKSIDALLGAEPAPNDATFIKALQAIQTNISNAITMDAIAASGGANADAVAKSEANWALVSDSIKQLESVTTAAELTAIINGTKITAVEATPVPTATPIVYKTLVKGDKNDDVQKMQVRLYELGFLNDDRDGNFGTKTQTAIKTFQERAGLKVTGMADSDTLALLYSDDAPYAPGMTTPTPKPTATPEPEKVIQPAEAQQAQ